MLVARRADRLTALADELVLSHGVQTRVVPEDLSHAGAAERVVERTADLKVGMLVKNAGLSAVGRFDLVPRLKIVEMIQVNCMAVATRTHAYLPAWGAWARSPSCSNLMASLQHHPARSPCTAVGVGAPGTALSGNYACTIGGETVDAGSFFLHYRR